MKLSSRIKNRLQYLALSGGIFLIRSLPYRVSLCIGRGCGLIAWACVPLHRNIAEVQVRNALGAGDARGIARRVFMHQGDVLVDAVRFAYMDENELRERIEIEGRENFDAAISSGRGVMIVTGHMNWEVLGHIPQILGTGFSIMGDIMKSPGLQAVIEDLRARCGFTLLPPKGGMVRRLTGELEQGRMIAMVIDQRGNRGNGLFCDLFGMPAPTSPAPALIALRGDALVLPVIAVKEGGKYVFRFEKPVDTREFGEDFRTVEHLSEGWRSSAVRGLSEYIQTWISDAVRVRSDQYFWLHSRWLRRSDMKRLLNTGGDFKAAVESQAKEYRKENASREY